MFGLSEDTICSGGSDSAAWYQGCVGSCSLQQCIPATGDWLLEILHSTSAWCELFTQTCLLTSTSYPSPYRAHCNDEQSIMLLLPRFLCSHHPVLAVATLCVTSSLPTSLYPAVFLCVLGPLVASLLIALLTHLCYFLRALVESQHLPQSKFARRLIAYGLLTQSGMHFHSKLL